MQADPTDRRRETLLLAACALFTGFFVTAEILGAKLRTFTVLGLSPAALGVSDSPHFVATAGILAFPLTFVLTDVVNEYFGIALVRVLTFLAIAVNLLLQPVIQAAIRVPTISFQPGVESARLHEAYTLAFGQTWAIVAASLIAFLVAQLVDARVFTALRHATGGRWLWLRAQGSTVISQVVDTLLVIFLAFWIIPELAGQPHMRASEAWTISLTNYVYKFVIAVGITPVLYLVHFGVEAWLGRERAHALAHAAHPRDPL
jgi:uncharacterized integral membrane protein (TIGR00697 family)